MRNLLLEIPHFGFVRVKGLEPPRLSALDPKSSAATNYATRANPNAKVRIFPESQNIFPKKYKNIFCLRPYKTKT